MQASFIIFVFYYESIWLFLADYELLFNTALGMYDFHLAKAVARNSQMDPKVYLPMLQRLSSFPEFRAKYEVDVMLKNFESALTNLFKSGLNESTDLYCYDEDHFEMRLSFIEEHKLHRLRLELFHNNSVWHRRILIALGEQLLRENKSDAALQYSNPQMQNLRMELKEQHVLVVIGEFTSHYC